MGDGVCRQRPVRCTGPVFPTPGSSTCASPVAICFWHTWGISCGPAATASVRRRYVDSAGCRERRVGMIRGFDSPFIPDGDEARRWAEDELTNPRYAEAKPTWFDLLSRDVSRFLAELFTSGNGTNVGPVALIVVTVVIAAALILALIVWGRPRSARVARAAHLNLLGSTDDRSASELRADADRSARNDEWDAATILRFRAMALGLIERDLISPPPGATAQSIAREISRVFITEATAVRQAAVFFDDVRYLGLPSTAQRYTEISATDERLVALHPELVTS